MFKVRISTDAYKPRRCSKKNWEPGTMNDFMEALNQWNNIEPDKQCLRWRIAMFAHNCMENNWDTEKNWYTDKYKEWENNPKNKITYFDKLCEFERTSNIEVYGFAQGYFNVDKVIKELNEKGKVRIPFSWAYDSRQYLKNMDGCFMEIIKIN
jgi:hypothetical protein